MGIFFNLINKKISCCIQCICIYITYLYKYKSKNDNISLPLLSIMAETNFYEI